MITKCRQIEIMRKKFSDFDDYEKNENQIFLVGYEIDADGNKKNIKINTSDVGLNENNCFKAKKFESITDGLYDDYYVDSTTKTVTFNLTNCMDFIQINSVDQSLLVDCEDADPRDGKVKHLSIDTMNSQPGKKTKMLLRNVCPEDVDTVYIIFNNYIIAEIKQNQHVIIEILHTYDSEILIARSQELEIPN